MAYTAMGPVTVTVKVLKHDYTPRGAALDLMSCTAPEVLLSGPAGTGKSRACLEKMHALCKIVPGMKALIVRQTARSLADSAAATFQDIVALEDMQAGYVTYYGGSERKPPVFRYSNGSTIAMGGMDKPLKVMSTEYDLIYAQEAIELNVTGWEALNSRLRNGRLPYQQLIADCNPDRPTHWLRQRCLSGATVMLHCRHEDNPRHFHPDGTMTAEGAAYMARLDSLTGVRRLRWRDGIWAAAEGVIFDTFDEGVHVVNEFPPGWERWETMWVIDFGFTNPFVWQEWCIDPDGRGWLNQEIYHTQRLVEDHAKQIRELTRDRPRPRKVVCDHDAEDRATLERHLGIRTIAANKNVSEGIQATMARLRVLDDGLPRILIRKNTVVETDASLVDAGKPASTIDEIPGYVWNDAKDAPVKENDHGCDTVRYFTAENDLRSATKVHVPTGGWSQYRGNRGRRR